MLDQNTDRMWFVIGAVIVGAAIIFIANGTLPTLFASVTDSFEESAENGTEVISEIRPNTRRNLIPNGHIEAEGGYSLANDGSIASGWQPEFLRHVDLAPIFKEYGPDATYTLEFEAKSKDPSRQDTMQVYMQSGTWSSYGFIREWFGVSEEYQSYRYEGLKAHAIPSSPYDSAHLAFYGIYGTGSIPVVRNVKLYLE